MWSRTAHIYGHIFLSSTIFSEMSVHPDKEDIEVDIMGKFVLCTTNYNRIQFKFSWIMLIILY